MSIFECKTLLFLVDLNRKQSKSWGGGVTPKGCHSQKEEQNIGVGSWGNRGADSRG